MATEPDTTAVSAFDRASDAFQNGDVQAGVDVLSTAIRQFTETGDVRQAALSCARLGWAFETFVGNRTAARVWIDRANRLLADEPDCVEQGWVALAGLGCDVDDPEVLLARAELALDRARRFGDVNLEAKALADGGLAHVQAGRVSIGMQMLDEAIALWCGPADDRDAASQGVCSFFTACYYSAEYDRASHWVEDLRRVGLLGAAAGAQIFLSSHCDAVQATALVELGQWSEAEAVLARAITAFESCMPIPSWHPAIALAELRIRQGRLGEAEALLLGKEAHLQALLPTAHLHLARGDTDLALATASRGLRLVGSDVLRGIELLAVGTEAHLAAHRMPEARALLDQLTARSRHLGVPKLRALTEATRARLLAATGDLAGALTLVEAAVDGLPAGLPVLRVELTLELVALHHEAGNRSAATVEAHRVAGALERLDITLRPDRRGLLHRFTGAPTGTRTARLLRDANGWSVTCDGTRLRLPGTKGLRYLAVLLASPGVERHVLDLVDEVEGVASDGPDRHRLGDAGVLVDGTARRAYRRRVEELRVEVEEALADGADDRAAALQEECDRLVDHLAAAFGLAGRCRPAASSAERARLNVTRALRTAVARVRADLPAAGDVLDLHLRTGIYCAFEPDPDDPVHWVVQPGSFSPD